MSWWRCASLRDLFTDQSTENWVARARTPNTRARIRRWSRAENVSLVVALFGVVLLAIAPFVTVALLIALGIAGVERTDVYWWIWGVSAGIPVAGMFGSVISSARLDEARYADGHVSVGVVERVVEHPGGGDDHTWYQLHVSAELHDDLVLRRRLHWPDDGNDPRRLIGGPIRFRHNTFDPDDLQDCLYDGIP